MTVLILFISVQTVNAGADWQEKQTQMFAQIPVTPGDVIDQSNWEKVKDILPEAIVDWAKRGEWVLNIDEFKYDFDDNLMDLDTPRVKPSRHSPQNLRTMTK